jgi:hypothetical protein
MAGILALWHNLAPGAEELFPRWYNRQHLFERVGVPGFRFGQRYQATQADRRFFCFYQVDDPAVLASPAYMARLDNPTEWTRGVMPHFRDMLRTVCTITHSQGALLGSHAVTWRCDGTPQAHAATLAMLGARDDVAQVQLWQAAATQTPANNEASLRHGDGLIGGALLVQCIGEQAARDVAACDVSAVVGSARPQGYALLAARYPSSAPMM